ncbi:MAG TPA: type II toxin-antitoxin system VapC family toxin [Xanthobacteraceae bacterium]|nr:type II toxin-antitoxin system VapC family toxin [Xanthobacteraceae bacterium]
MILLDTHVALWSTIDSDSLGKRCRRIIRQALAENQLAVSAVTFWEIALLVAKGRLRWPLSANEARRVMLSEGAIELPLTGEIAILAGELEGLHADPADRFIAATAIAHDATLVTADDRLLQWRHGMRRHNAET